MARFQIKRREDGRGPYRWQHAIRLPEGLALGSIYIKQGDDLSIDEALVLRRHYARVKYDVRHLNLIMLKKRNFPVFSGQWRANKGENWPLAAVLVIRMNV